ncbi:MAG: Brix domain-containing protein [Candidatus Methanofastidiosia archaeon]
MLITTSRKPSKRTRTFCRELECVIPLSLYVQRGKKGIRELVALAYEKGMERIMLVESKGGNPASLEFIKVNSNSWEFLGKIEISVTLRREMGVKKLKKLEEDLSFMIKSAPEEILNLFKADSHIDSDTYCFAELKKEILNFYRLDYSSEHVGPKIKIRDVYAQTQN